MPSPPTPHTPLPVWAWSPLSHLPHITWRRDKGPWPPRPETPRPYLGCVQRAGTWRPEVHSACAALLSPSIHISHPSPSLCFFLPFSSLVPSPLPPHQMHSFLWPDHKEASSKDKGSPGTEQEVLTVAFSKGGRHPPTLAASTLLAPAARGGTGAKTP